MAAVKRSGQEWAFKDETGNLHGEWRVVERSVPGGNGARWRCRCETCGARRVIYGCLLRAGRAPRCLHGAPK